MERLDFFCMLGRSFGNNIPCLFLFRLLHFLSPLVHSRKVSRVVYDDKLSKWVLLCGFCLPDPKISFQLKSLHHSFISILFNIHLSPFSSTTAEQPFNLLIAAFSSLCISWILVVLIFMLLSRHNLEENRGLQKEKKQN